MAEDPWLLAGALDDKIEAVMCSGDPEYRTPAERLGEFVVEHRDAILAALRSDAGAEMRERCAQAADREANWHEHASGGLAAIEATAAAIRALPLQPEEGGAS